MYEAYSLNFNLKKDSYYETSKKLYSQMKRQIDHNLQNFYKAGVLDGSKLSKEWFPEIEADVFIMGS